MSAAIACWTICNLASDPSNEAMREQLTTAGACEAVVKAWYVGLCICRPICMYVRLSVCLSICLSVCLSVSACSQI